MQSTAVRAQVFRVEQFRNPKLSEERRLAYEALESQPLDLSVAGVLSAARTQSGLDDFGSMDFTDRLGRLLAEVEADPNVWKSVKASFVARCIKAADMRLRNRDYLKRHPRTRDVRIEGPIIVVGLPRSGTTHVENLIAADRRLRYLPVYLGAEATPKPGEKSGPDGVDPRWRRSNDHWQQMKAHPIMAAMHEHSPDHACGENELQIPDFASYQWEWMADVPKWRDYYYATDQAPHYEYGRTVLQAIVHQFPNERRWIMKGNQNSEQLVPLSKVYPDAIIVQTHRDPLAILQSVLTMRGLAVLAQQKVPDIDAHVNYWVDRIEHMLRAYIRDMDIIPSNRRIDFLFQDVIADDVGATQKVLETAGLESTPDSREDLKSYMDHHPRGKAGRVVYDLAGDFRLDIGELRDRFRFYTDRFPVRHEVM